MLVPFVIALCCLASLASSAAVPRYRLDSENVDICTLPPSYFLGVNCISSFDVWTFNPLTNICHFIPNGGCLETLDTENMFESEFKCQARCVKKTELAHRGKRNAKCNLPQAQGHCRAYFDRFYYDPYTNQCQPFIYTGCGGNENNFISFRDCQRSCI